MTFNQIVIRDFAGVSPQQSPLTAFFVFTLQLLSHFLSARVKMSVSKRKPEGVLPAFRPVWSAFVFGLHVPMDSRGIVTRLGGFVVVGVLVGKKLVSQQSLLNEVN